jgi:hypothetical protein
MIAIVVAVTCLILALRSLIFRGNTKPPGYQVWILTVRDDNGGFDDLRALDDWPSEIAVPTDFFTNTKPVAAFGATFVAQRTGLNGR